MSEAALNFEKRFDLEKNISISFSKMTQILKVLFKSDLPKSAFLVSTFWNPFYFLRCRIRIHCYYSWKRTCRTIHLEHFHRISSERVLNTLK